MVRFSDLLGGNDNPEEPPRRAAPAPVDPAAALRDAGQDEEQEEDDAAEDVLERLTQFATSARTSTPEPADPPVPDPEPARAPAPDAEPGAVPDAQADAPAVLTPVADDLLPRAKGGKSRKRGR
jgi:hypothetical protein